MINFFIFEKINRPFRSGKSKFVLCYVIFTQGNIHPVIGIIGSMLLHLAKETRFLAQVLSVFVRPIPSDIVKALSVEHVSDVQSTLNTLERLGMLRRTEATVEIKYPILRTRLYASIPKQLRVDLNRKVFLVLEELKCERDVLAHHAFEAGMFSESSNLFRALANAAFEDQQHRTALQHYQRLQECRSGSFLTPDDKLKMARCYRWTGKQRRAKARRRGGSAG